MDLQMTVDEIRQALQAIGSVGEDKLGELAEAYAQGCLEANRRLKQCERLINQGLRSEAIHEANQPPNLVELVALLDFPEREEWDQVCSEKWLTLAPGLFMESAAALNEAYGAEDPLTDLLQTHRRLALARADLGQRLATLRKIQMLDPANPLWELDVRTYERARLKQIQVLARSAARDGNAEALDRLAKELDKPDWIEPRLGLSAQEVRFMADRARRDQAREQLKQLVEPLHDAYSALDLDRGRELARRWKKLAPVARLDSPDETEQQARPALLWVEEAEDREQRAGHFRAAVADLEAALDHDTKIEELERLRAAATKFDRPLPSTLEVRLHSRIDALKLESSRRWKARMLATALVVAAGSLLLGFTLHQTSQQHAAEQAVAAIDRLLDADRVEDAAKFLETLRDKQPSIARSTAVLEATARLEDSLRREKQRSDRFRELLAAAENAELGPDEPPSLKEAAKVARTTPEKAAIANLKSRRQTDWLDLAAAREAQLRPRLEPLQTLLLQIQQEAKTSTNLASFRERIIAFRKDAHALLADAQSCTDSFRRSCEALVQRGAALDDEVGRLIGMRELEEQMTALIATTSGSGPERLAPYLDAMKLYLQRYPSSRRAEHFQATIAERPLWESALAWQETVANSSLAPNLGPRVEAYLAAYPSGPDRPRAEALAAVLRSFADRRTLRQELADYLRKPPANSLWMAVTGTGMRFYSIDKLEKPRTMSALRFPYLANPSLDQEMIVLSARSVVEVREAPQCALARALLDILLDDSILERWDDPFIDMLSRIVHDEDTDPILQAQMLDRIASVGTRGSSALKDALANFTTQLAGLDFKGVAWMNPSDADARDKAADVRAKLPSLLDLTAVRRLAAENREKHAALLAWSVRPVGWLLRDEAVWSVRLAPSIGTAKGDLYMIEPGLGGSSPRWQRIGWLEAAQPQLAITQFPGDPEGRIVFLVAETQGVNGQPVGMSGAGDAGIGAASDG